MFVFTQKDAVIEGKSSIFQHSSRQHSFVCTNRVEQGYSALRAQKGDISSVFIVGTGKALFSNIHIISSPYMPYII